MNTEKFAYENIEVPDDRLVQAIYSGMGRAKRIKRRQYAARSLTTEVAEVVVLL